MTPADREELRTSALRKLSAFLKTGYVGLREQGIDRARVLGIDASRAASREEVEVVMDRLAKS